MILCPAFIAKQPFAKQAAAVKRALSRVAANPLADETLALYFLEGITGKEEYNEAVGALMGWGFLVIGVPCLVLWMFALFRMVNRIKIMTGLELEEVMLPR